MNDTDKNLSLLEKMKYVAAVLTEVTAHEAVSMTECDRAKRFLEEVIDRFTPDFK